MIGKYRGSANATSYILQLQCLTSCSIRCQQLARKLNSPYLPSDLRPFSKHHFSLSHQPGNVVLANTLVTIETILHTPVSSCIEIIKVSRYPGNRSNIESMQVEIRVFGEWVSCRRWHCQHSGKHDTAPAPPVQTSEFPPQVPTMIFI